ncbi:ATP-binding cassette domain-containing protein [Listeria ivanovii]|uniref:ATP-binding cassette domain-containing protein n=1 Tax=Listeria ivanovii TaxID=1638 RepID=UPI0027E3B288|nr:ATP-binding cassette domain-containing protein [Listeria ivanovii]
MREIKLKAVSKTLKKREVIRDVTITMGGNNVYGFQGVNGSGKTVLFKLILGFLKPTIGEIFIDGKKCMIKLNLHQIPVLSSSIPDSSNTTLALKI